MDDLISRQAAIDEGEEWIETYNSGRGGQRERDAIKHVISGIKKLPSAQEGIIRCKDCKWYGRADKRRFYRGMDCLQKRIDTIIPDKDFCSRAERREE